MLYTADADQLIGIPQARLLCLGFSRYPWVQVSAGKKQEGLKMKLFFTAVLAMLGTFAAFSPLQAQERPCAPNCPEITYVELTGGSFTMGDTRGVPFPVATPPTVVTVNDSTGF